MIDIVDEITALLGPLVEVLGFELWGCELRGQGRHNILFVYIDGPEGVTIDDCARVSNQISGILDVEDLISGSYDLEVSSPGMDRLMFTIEQFAKYIGREVKIKLHQARGGRRNFAGVIKTVDEKKIVVIVDEIEVEVDIADIDKAKLVPEF